MASITIEDSVYEEFINIFPDEIVQKEVASMQIAKLIGAASKHKRVKTINTTLEIHRDHEVFLKEHLPKVEMNRKQYFCHLINNADEQKLALRLYSEGKFSRTSRAEMRSVSFTPDVITFKKWGDMGIKLNASKQLIIMQLIKFEMEKSKA